MLCLSLHRYHPVWNDWVSDLLYYAALPILTIVVLLRRNPLDFGLKWGEYKVWSYYVAIVCLVAAPILFATSLTPAFQSCQLFSGKLRQPGCFRIFLSWVCLIRSERQVQRGKYHCTDDSICLGTPG
jgi:hypothetical protein